MGPPNHAQGLVQRGHLNHSTFMESILYYMLGSVLGADLAVNKMQTLLSWSPQFQNIES